MPRNDIVGSQGKLLSGLLRKCNTDIHSGCTILFSHQQCSDISHFLQSCQQLLSFLLLILDNLTGVEWILKVISVCTSQTDSWRCWTFCRALLSMSTLCSVSSKGHHNSSHQWKEIILAQKIQISWLIKTLLKVSPYLTWNYTIEPL